MFLIHIVFFEPVTVQQGDQTITFYVAKRGLAIGTDKNSFEIPLDGPTAQAVAEMYNTSLPTAWLTQKVYESAKEKGDTIPFMGQHEWVKKTRT